MKTFYLAHSVPLSETMREWQLVMEGVHHIEIVNPFFKNHWEREQMEKLNKLSDEEKIKGLPEWTLEECVNIVTEDLKLIRQCDALIAIFDEPTIGTCQEIFVAAYVYHMPVYIITHKFNSHPWLRTLVKISNGKIFNGLLEFERWLRNGI